MTDSARARSSALRAERADHVDVDRRRLRPAATGPWRGMMPQVGLWPYTPQKCAGLRIDEPMSLPASSPVSPAASAAAEPPEDPPGARARSHGLLVVP